MYCPQHGWTSDATCLCPEVKRLRRQVAVLSNPQTEQRLDAEDDLLAENERLRAAIDKHHDAHTRHDYPANATDHELWSALDELVAVSEDAGLYDTPERRPEDICGFCGCARARCEQSEERFGTPRCCSECDH